MAAKLTINKLHELMKERFDKIDNSLQSVTETNAKINKDISHTRKEIMKNL